MAPDCRIDLANKHSSTRRLLNLGREPIKPEALANVRFGAHNGLKSDIAPCPKSAMNGLMQRSKWHFYSISSSARPLSASGTAMPSAFAVLRLIISSTLVDLWTGRSRGLAPLRIFPV
jgi:hypothetical protein